jgi:predicted helicase
MADQKTKATSIRSDEQAIFKLFSLGVVTSRDDWVWDRNKTKLADQIRFNVDVYNLHLIERSKAKGKIDFEAIYKVGEVKWTRLLRNCLEGGRSLAFDKSRIWPGSYRPFSKQSLYFDPILNEVQYQTHRLFDGNTPNPSITTMGDSSGKPYFTLAIDSVPDLNFVSPGSGGTMTFARYRYTKSGERVDNITDWAVAQFVGYYNPSPLAGEGGPASAGSGEGSGALATQSNIGAQTRAAPSPSAADAAPSSPARGEGKVSAPPVITKDAIFAYCYAVLHDPLYREKYALNLKREFPRIPFYPDFAQWVEWGEALLKLHIDYEKVKPAKLTRVDTPAPKRAEGTHPKPKLKSNPEAGNIVIDEDTQLTGVPVEAWEYRLGNRSAIDWVLDQHKEKTPRDPTIREKFNTYRFADYKESCIELLGRVVSVSVETMKFTEAMKALDRSGWK